MSKNQIEDVAGIGKLAKAIPQEAWNKLIATASNTFSALIAPITKTTAGLGRLIQVKFDSMVDVQKVYAADAVNRAKEKVERSRRAPQGTPKAKVLVPAIEGASLETDDTLRDVWANLIAHEMLSAGVHPEFPGILARLSPKDALTLSEIANKDSTRLKGAAKALGTLIVSTFGISVQFGEEPSDFSREHLERLGLVRLREGRWRLTLFGEEFVRVVTDPSFIETMESERAKKETRKP